MDPKEIKALLDACIERMNKLADDAKNAKRSLTEDESKTFDELEVEHAKLLKDLERAKKLAAINEEREKPTSQAVDIQVTREDKCDKDGNCKIWGSLEEQIKAVIRAGRHPHQTDKRLYESDKIVRAITGLAEGVSADGGFLVQTDFSTALLDKAYATGILAKMVQRGSISSGANGIRIPGVDETSRVDGSRYGGIQAYWESEADAYTGSKPKFRMIQLTLQKLIGLVYLTDELLEDTAFLENWVSMKFAEEFGFKLDDAIINGDGAGKPLGILNGPALITVNKESGQAAATLQVNNLVKMRARMPARSRAGMVWLYNQDIEPQLLTMSISVGNNAFPVYLPNTNVAGQMYDTLFARPSYAIEQAATLGTAGDIILVDPSQYMMVDKGSMKQGVSMHVRFLNDEQVLKFTYRVAGQPLWSSALTPFKGSNTQSPYIVCQSR